ncbi:MAG: DNRLRE domain-containing protein [Candidatus Thermoplasmatota archaeon]|nr:DNRLRE domain-containing protein [Candidatus Thermoplasmatota archaeon]
MPYRGPAAVAMVILMLLMSLPTSGPLVSADPDMRDNGDMTRSLLWNFTDAADYDLYNTTASGGFGKLLALNETTGENSTAQYLVGTGSNLDFLTVPDSMAVDNASLPLQSITLQPGPEGFDSYLDEWFPYWTPPDKGDLVLNSEYDPAVTYNGQSRIIMMFNLSSVPADAIVKDATLLLYQRSGKPQVIEYSIRAVNVSWDEQGVSWMTKDLTHSWNNIGGDYSDESFSSGTVEDSIGWHGFDLTRLVDLWLRGATPNYGFIIYPKPQVGDAEKIFTDCEITNKPEQRPKLVINYTIGEAVGIYESSPLGPGTNSTFTLASWNTGIISRASDEFDNESLSPKWHWMLDPTTSGGSVNFDRAGWLNVTGSQPTYLPNASATCNFLYQDITGDFAAESRVWAYFASDSMGAGLMVMNDAVTWVSVYITGSEGAELIVSEASNGGVRTSLGSMPWSDSTAFLRMERNLMEYRCLASADGMNWTAVGTYAPPYDLGLLARLGPFVFSGGSTLNPCVELDFVRILPSGDGTALEVSARAGNSTSLADPSWGAWSTPLSPETGAVFGGAGMYVQYRAVLSTARDWLSPILSGFECHYETHCMNGTITTREVAPGAFLMWESMTVTQTLTAGEVEYLYSTDHGAIWTSLGYGDSFPLSISVPTLMIRAELRTPDAAFTPSIDSIEVVYSISHAFFYVSAPETVQAGEPFSVYIEPKDSDNNTATWTGTVTLHAVDPWGMEGASGELAVTQADVPAGGQLTISDQRYHVAETIKVLVTGGGETGMSQGITVVPGPASYISIEPDVTRLAENSITVFNASVCDSFGNSLSGSSITWSADAGLGTINTTTGSTVTLTTVAWQSSGYLTASAAGLTKSLFILVSPPRLPPDIASDIPVQTKLEDSGSWTLDISPYISDEEDSLDQLRWYTTNETFVRVTGENRTGETIVTFTTIQDKCGINVLDLWVVDSDRMSSKGAIVVDLIPVNDPPKIDPIDPMIVRYDDPYQYNLEFYVKDVDTPKDDLTVSVDPVSAPYVHVSNLWLTILYPEQFNGTQQTVFLSVTDGEYTASTVILVTISDDQVPRALGSLPDQVMLQGEVKRGVFDLDDYFTDPDGSNLYYTNRNTHVGVLIQPNHTVDFYAPIDWAGDEYIIFTAKDEIGARAESPLRMKVISVNQPPTISDVPDLVVRYDLTYNFDLRPYISDQDNDVGGLVVTVDDPHAWTLGTLLSMQFPSSMDGMKVPLNITVSDGLLFDWWTINVTVSDDYPPELVMAAPSHSFLEDNPMDYPVSSHIEDFFTDTDNDPLTFSCFMSVPYVGAELMSTDGEWSVHFSTDENWYGSANLTLRATDPEGALVETTVPVTVVSVPDVPVLRLPDSLSVTQGSRSLLEANRNVTDPDSVLTDFRWTIDSLYPDFISTHGGIIVFDFPLGFLEDGEASRTITVTVTVIDQDNLVGTDNVTITVLKNVVVERQEPLLLVGLIASVSVAAILSAYAVIRRKKPFVVHDMMLIHNDGFLISRLAHRTENEIDENILSGMLTAVLNFVEDSMARSAESLKIFGFKEYQVLVSRGQKVFTAVVYRGDLPTGIEKTLKDFLNTVEKVYRKKLMVWSGDIETDFTGVEVLIHAWVKEHSHSHRRTTSGRSWVHESSQKATEQTADDRFTK